MLCLVFINQSYALSGIKVHFINVGSGDGILIECHGETALIDGGYVSQWAQYGDEDDPQDPLLNDVDRAFEKVADDSYKTKTEEEKNDIALEIKEVLQQNRHNEVVDYLDQLGIQKIDILISTHPHQDHIGGLLSVICNFPIGKIYKSKLEYSTRYALTFDRLIQMDEHLKSVTSVPQENEQFRLGGDNGAVFTVLNDTSADYHGSADNSNGDTNNYSLVLRMDYGQRSFLFTGDSQRTSQAYILENHENQVQVDILKQPHHGYANPDGFIDANHSGHYAFTSAVNANITVVSCGPSTPHPKVVNDMANSDVYQTKDLGTIVMASDGDRIEISYGNKLVYAFVKGDLNGDGQITPADYVMIRRQILGTYTLKGNACWTGDINGDGQITPADYVMVRRHILGTYTIQ